MDFSAIFATFTPEAFALTVVIMLVAGLVKGAVGFAMPMIAAGGLGAFLGGQEIVAMLILPTLLTNIWQVMRQGRAAAVATLRRFWKMNLAMCVAIPFSAPLLPLVSSETLILLLGLLVLGAAAIQLFGWEPVLPQGPAAAWMEVIAGLAAGMLAGLAAIWGPPVLLFFIALRLEKTERIRAQGLNFVAGAAILVPAHISTGVLNAGTLPLSILLTVPVAIGMAVGLRWQDGMNQQLFRRLTLVVLCLAGLNLLRRALF